MSASLACNLCSGGCVRGDVNLRVLYDTIRGDCDRISNLVSYSPCAATKMFLLTGDKSIAQAIDSYHKDSLESLPECSKRNTSLEQLSFIQSSRDKNGLPQIYEIARAVKEVMNRSDNPSSSMSVRSNEEFYGTRDPSLDPSTVQAQAFDYLEQKIL